MIKVSVIVAVYNAEEYLEKCLDSLIGQALDEIEVIAVDDGSVDSSAKILEEYAARSAKIKIITKPNGGAAEARNHGLSLASGEYVGFIDSDDFADPEMYEELYGKAAEKNFDIVECNLRHNYPDGEDIETVAKYYSRRELLCFGRYVIWNKIFRRKLLTDAGAMFPAALIYEDVAFVAKLIPYINSYGYIDAAPVHYVQRRGSVNNSTSEKTMDIFPVLDDIKKFYINNGFYDDYKNELEYLYARILICSSFKRMCRIGDGALRERALTLNYLKLTKDFPNWKTNSILKTDRSRNALFMKTQNAFTYKISCAVFPALFYLKDRLDAKR